jgi:hypothetical protein
VMRWEQIACDMDVEMTDWSSKVDESVNFSAPRVELMMKMHQPPVVPVQGFPGLTNGLTNVLKCENVWVSAE